MDVKRCAVRPGGARVLAYQGQVPVRPALAYSRAEIHPVPTGNVGPKKTRLSAGSSCWVDHQLSVIVNMIAATITKNPTYASSAIIAEPRPFPIRR